MKYRLKETWFLLTFVLPVVFFAYGAEPVKNIIFMIGDGMGYQQVRAAGMYKGGPLCFESFPHTAQQTTLSAGDSITDSAAGSTALATGVKVSNDVLSLRIPGDASRLETILEYAKKRGRRTGLVTTVPMTHATPAGFGAHAESRSDTATIAYEYLNVSHPNVLLGC
ncbi:MAG: alkaline phosphatase, partial [Pontiellaceae bacterium]|nr:alkaline phosphatase [Pontiellaceae bacterium]